MAYYRGDYYRGSSRGDYYRGRSAGDPFWGALWTGIKAVGGALLGVRPAAQVNQATASGGLTGVMTAQAIGTRLGEAGRNMLQLQPSPSQVLSPNARPIGRIPTIAENRALIGARVDPATGAIVMRRRRMNPANPRALRRSIRRVVGFGKLAMRSRRAVSKAATAIGCNTGRRSYRGPRRRAS